jgi:hypothetical protein
MTTARIGCAPVASPLKTPGTAFAHNRIRPVAAGHTRNRASAQGTGWARSARGNFRRKLPLLYLSANENENRPGTIKYSVA